MQQKQRKTHDRGDERVNPYNRLKVSAKHDKKINLAEIKVAGYNQLAIE